MMSASPLAWMSPASPMRALVPSARLLLAIVLAIVLPLATNSHAARAEPVLDMQAGETRVLAHPGLSRVAVGNGQVIQAVAADGEVVLFARQEGQSSLHVWAGKTRRAYTVRVAPARWRQLQAEVQELLARIPRARGSTVGDQIVIEGDDLSDADRERVAGVAQRYPQVLDFTGKVGWDRMVMLDVQVVELPRSRLQELGVRWNSATQGGVEAGLAVRSTAPAVGYLGVNALLSSRIDLLAQSGEAVILAQPQLLARSGSTAEFLAGGEVPYSSVDKQGHSSTTFKPYGVSLRITPTVEASGIVRSRIEVEASAVDPSVASKDGPALKTRRATTEFNVRSGRTLVIGGFLSRERSQETAGLPGLKDIPVVGALFGSRRQHWKETELAVFVTPVVVSEDHPAMLRATANRRAVLDGDFAQAPRLLHPAPADLAADAAAPAWDPYSGPGSQWENPAAPAGARTTMDAATSKG
jgi:pilus assembly protein CpaC